MKPCILMLLCPLAGLFSDIIPIENADEITEEWLVNLGERTGCTEHIRHFKPLFNQMHVRTFLEFGLGFSTKYFIDHSEKVISVEFVTPGGGPEWLIHCIDLYRNYNTWLPIAYFSGQGLDISCAPHTYLGLESVYKAAAYQPVYLKSYALIDPSFLDDLNHFIEGLIAHDQIDIAFVDAGICIRGDLVQLLFNKVAIIAAHDTNISDDRYGYGRIIVPNDYLTVHVPFGMGTTFWIKKEAQYLKVIQTLQDYVKLPLT